MLNLITRMIEESDDFGFDGTIRNIKEFLGDQNHKNSDILLERIFKKYEESSKNYNILNFGLPQKGHNEIQLLDMEIESYENQYLLAHVIK